MKSVKTFFIFSVIYYFFGVVDTYLNVGLTSKTYIDVSIGIIMSYAFYHVFILKKDVGNTSYEKTIKQLKFGKLVYYVWLAIFIVSSIVTISVNYSKPQTHPFYYQCYFIVQIFYNLYLIYLLTNKEVLAKISKD
ncbi:MAG: putative membrane-anchored protein [Lysobacterales bacterium]|jgi:uncharacterized membrane-anchored protein